MLGLNQRPVGSKPTVLPTELIGYDSPPLISRRVQSFHETGGRPCPFVSKHKSPQTAHAARLIAFLKGGFLMKRSWCGELDSNQQSGSYPCVYHSTTATYKPVARPVYLPTNSDSFTPSASAIADIVFLSQLLSPRSTKNNLAGVMPTACDSCHCVQPFFCLARRINCPVVTAITLLVRNVDFGYVAFGLQSNIYQVTYQVAH